MLGRSLSRTFSNRGLAGGVSEQGLRSTTLLHNYIENNANGQDVSRRLSHLSASINQET